MFYGKPINQKILGLWVTCSMSLSFFETQQQTIQSASEYFSNYNIEEPPSTWRIMDLSTQQMFNNAACIKLICPKRHGTYHVTSIIGVLIQVVLKHAKSSHRAQWLDCGTVRSRNISEFLENNSSIYFPDVLNASVMDPIYQENYLRYWNKINVSDFIALDVDELLKSFYRMTIEDIDILHNNEILDVKTKLTSIRNMLSNIQKRTIIRSLMDYTLRELIGG